MSYEQIQTEDRRLVILRLLANSDGYAANEFLVARALQDFGHVVSHDRLRADLAWLTEQDLISVRDQGVLVATLSSRGDDVQAGRARCPGVKRPVPGE